MIVPFVSVTVSVTVPSSATLVLTAVPSGSTVITVPAALMMVSGVGDAKPCGSDADAYTKLKEGNSESRVPAIFRSISSLSSALVCSSLGVTCAATTTLPDEMLLIVTCEALTPTEAENSAMKASSKLTQDVSTEFRQENVATSPVTVTNTVTTNGEVGLADGAKVGELVRLVVVGVSVGD